MEGGKEEARGWWEGGNKGREGRGGRGREGGNDGREGGKGGRERGSKGARVEAMMLCGGELQWRKGGLREGGLMKGTSEEGTERGMDGASERGEGVSERRMD